MVSLLTRLPSQIESERNEQKSNGFSEEKLRCGTLSFDSQAVLTSVLSREHLGKTLQLDKGLLANVTQQTKAETNWEFLAQLLSRAALPPQKMSPVKTQEHWLVRCMLWDT